MTRSPAWGIALIIALGAAVLAGGASQQAGRTKPAPPARDARLARCLALGQAAGEDADCRSAWSAERARFFGEAAS